MSKELILRRVLPLSRCFEGVCDGMWNDDVIIGAFSHTWVSSWDPPMEPQGDGAPYSPVSPCTQGSSAVFHTTRMHLTPRTWMVQVKIAMLVGEKHPLFCAFEPTTLSKMLRFPKFQRERAAGDSPITGNFVWSGSTQDERSSRVPRWACRKGASLTKMPPFHETPHGVGGSVYRRRRVLSTPTPWYRSRGQPPDPIFV